MAKASDKYRNWFDSDKLVSDLMDQAADDIDERDAEIERLRNVVENWRELVGAKVFNEEMIKMKNDEIERFREALFSVKDCLEDKNYIDAEMIIDNTFQQKDSE